MPKDELKWDSVEVVDEVRLKEALSAGGSAGNLPKWLLEDDWLSL